MINEQWPLKVLGYFLMSKKRKIGSRMIFDDSIWKNPKLFDGKFEDKERSIKVYYDWIDYVKSKVPKEQLLVFNVKEGWEPLCKFLRVDQPKDCKEFPRSNSTKDILKDPGLARMLRISKLVKIVTYASWVGAVGIICKYYFAN